MKTSRYSEMCGHIFAGVRFLPDTLDAVLTIGGGTDDAQWVVAPCTLEVIRKKRGEEWPVGMTFGIQLPWVDGFTDKAFFQALMEACITAGAVPPEPSDLKARIRGLELRLALLEGSGGAPGADANVPVSLPGVQ